MESEQPQAGAEKTLRFVRPSLIVLCGPAASGKSTFAARYFRPTQIVSSDRCRALVCDDEADQRFQPQAFALLHTLIEQRLSINRLCVVDSTALTEAARSSLLSLARRYRVPSVAVVLDVPLETCVARDRARGEAGAASGGRSVGQAVIEHQYRLFEEAKPALRRERFDQIIVLTDQDLARVRVEIIFRPAPRPMGNKRPEPRRPGPRPAPAWANSVEGRPPEPTPSQPPSPAAQGIPQASPGPAASPAAGNPAPEAPAPTPPASPKAPPPPADSRQNRERA